MRTTRFLYAVLAALVGGFLVSAADTDPIAPLVTKLKSSDPAVRLAAVKGLAALGAAAKPALPELVRVFQAESWGFTVAELDRPPMKMFQTVGSAIGGGAKLTPEEKKKQEEQLKKMKEEEDKRLAEWHKAKTEWMTKNLAAQKARIEFFQAALSAFDKIDPKAAEQQLGLTEARRDIVTGMLSEIEAMYKGQEVPPSK